VKGWRRLRRALPEGMSFASLATPSSSTGELGAPVVAVSFSELTKKVGKAGGGYEEL